MDQQLFLLINREWTSPALDLFMAAISSWGILIYPAFLLGGAMLIFGGFKARASVFSIALAVALADGVVAKSLKNTVGRPRPNDVLARVRMVTLRKTSPKFLALFREPQILMSRPKYGAVEGRSFPSSHTVNNFCAAAILTCFFRRWGWLYFIPAFAIGYSRIYTGSHWPSDVVTSIFLGTGLGFLCIGLLEWLWGRFGSRIVPAIHATHPSLVA